MHRRPSATGWTVITSASLAQAKQLCYLDEQPSGVGRPRLCLLSLRFGRAGRSARAAHCDRRTATEGNGAWLSSAGWASAVLRNGLGRYEEALAAAVDGSTYPDELGMANWCLVELVEAAARAGVPERASGAMERIAEMADACRTDWIRGIEARSRALLTEAQGLMRSAAVRSNAWGVRVCGRGWLAPSWSTAIICAGEPPGRRARAATTCS
jgi:hypothetical protein